MASSCCDENFVSSARAHIHQLLCSDVLDPGMCRCHAIGVKTMEIISSEWNPGQLQNKLGNTMKLTLSSINQVEKQSKLAEAGQRVHHGCFSSCYHECQKQQNEEQGSKPLTEVLIGYLTNLSKDGDKTGEMYLKDPTSVIPCQILDCDMNWLRQLLVVYCWNCITDTKACSYIEVCHHCQPLLVPLSNDLAGITGWPVWMDAVLPQEDVLDVGDAQQLLSDRSKEGALKDPSSHLALHGTAIAKSPLYRVRSTPFFFFELASDDNISKVPVLAKGNDTAYLHHFVSIGRMYTVTRLLPTTINKGTKSPYPVLLCTKKTRIFRQGTSCLSLKPTISAMIVDCINKETGIYELEGNIRLYLCYLYDGSKQYQHFRVGTKITVHNAHDYKIGKPQRHCIVCCMRSTVVITEYSQFTPSKNKQPIGSEKSLLHLILKLNPSPARLHWLCSIWPRLQQNLGQLIHCKKPEYSALWTLVTSPSSCGNIAWITPRKRNIYEEFLDHSTHPCIAAKDSQDDGIFPQFLSVNDLCNIFSSTSESIGCDRIIADTKNWKCRAITSTNIQPPQVLVGYLESNSQTGQLQLVDKTGTIQCLVTNTDDIDLNKTEPKPDALQNTTNDDSISHQHALPSLLDHVIRVDKFLVFLEDFVHCDDDDTTKPSGDDANKIASDGGNRIRMGGRTTQSSDHAWRRLYVVFSMRDTVVVCPKADLEPPKPVKRTASLAGLKQAAPTVNRGKQKSNGPSSVLFIVKNKSWLQQDCADSKHHLFFLDVELLDCPKFTNVDIKGLNAAKGQGIQAKFKPAAFWFNKEAVKWFPVLYPACIFSLSVDADCAQGEAVLQASTTGCKAYLNKVIEKAGCPQVLHVSPAAKLKALQENEIPLAIQAECHRLVANVHSNCMVNSLKQILTTENGPYDNVVSFRGIIVSCIYALAKAIRSHQVHPDWQMKLQVKDQEGCSDDSDATVRVYINVSPLTYPVGLIPGSIVTFRRCIKVKSSKGNVSCQVGALTDITIEHVPYDVPNRLHQSAADGQQHQSSSQYFLAELSTNQVTPDPMCHFDVACHVQAIHLLVLRWSCERCGRQECICPSTSHGTYKPGKITIQTKFAVDDGTGEAVVWCHNEGAVPILLGLTSAMWQQLKELLPHYGKVVYKYSRDEQSQWQDAAPLPQPTDDLESVLGMLCRHNSIQHPIRMKCRMLRSNQEARRGTRGTHALGTYANTKADATEQQSEASQKKYIPWLHLKCTELTTQ